MSIRSQLASKAAAAAICSKLLKLRIVIILFSSKNSSYLVEIEAGKGSERVAADVARLDSEKKKNNDFFD